jgi:hypothetical protein
MMTYADLIKIGQVVSEEKIFKITNIIKKNSKYIKPLKFKILLILVKKM